MGDIATSDRQITLYYNSNSVRAKAALAFAKVEGIAVHEIDVLKTPPTGTQLAELANKLHLKIEDLINQEHPDYKSQFEHHNFSDDDWIKMIRHNPEILKLPIALRGDRIILVENPEELSRL